MKLYDLLRKDVYCSSGIHPWSAFEEEESTRCCNGFTLVIIPLEYMDRVDEWIKLGSELYNPRDFSWNRVLIPDSESKLIAGLKSRVPEWTWEFTRPLPPEDELH
jgi:hypothetical protein